MLEVVKERLEEMFEGIMWESLKRIREDFSCNLPEIVVCMGVKDRREIILAFSKGLIAKKVAKKLNCDESLVSERELMNEVKSVSLDVIRGLERDVIPYPTVLKGNFMELMVHKAILDAYCGKTRDGILFVGVVEPLEELTTS